MRVERGERFSLYLGDAADALPLLCDEDGPRDTEGRRLSLLCTDPPYGARWQSGRRAKAFARIVGDDGGFDALGLLGAWTSALSVHRHIYVFGSTFEALREPLRLGSGCDLVWDRGNAGSGDLSCVWGPQHDTIGFGVYVPSKAGRAAGGGALAARLRRGSVLRSLRPNGGAGVRRHPTEKPVDLMRQLVESSTVLDDLVADPFAGSGSTLVAAILLGRRALGVEVDPEHFETALARCRAAEATWLAASKI